MMNIETQYGPLLDICAPSYYKAGQLESCIVQQKTTIHTAYGDLVPQYHYDDVRHKHIPSVIFYPDGTLKNIALDQITKIKTPLGIFPAELLLFHPNGTLKKLFPLNGKLSAYWSEEMESELTRPLKFNFAFGAFIKKIISLTFYNDSKLKSLTLFPGETVTLTTALGTFVVKTGFSLYPDGTLKSIEPAKPSKIKTPIGEVRAFDPLSIGIHADTNSLEFTENHQLKKLKTLNQIDVFNASGDKIDTFSPLKKRSELDDDIYFSVPLSLEFKDGCLNIEHQLKHSYKLSTHTFAVSA